MNSFLNFKYINRIILSVILFCFLFNISNAEITSKGKEFWFNLFTLEKDYGDSIKVSINADFDAEGTITLINKSWTQTFQVSANNSKEFILPYSDNGIVHIQSNNDITVSVLYMISAAADAELILPVSSLGTDYFIMAYTPLSPYGSPSKIRLLAINDNTTITIVPSADMSDNYSQFHSKGVAFNKVLNANESFEGSSAYDLTGTHIYSVDSQKQFAVYSSTSVNIPYGYGTRNTIFEQMIPTNSWGTEYHSVPFKTKIKGDTYRIMALNDATFIKINGKQIDTILNTGEFYECILLQPSVITSASQISVAQYSNSCLYDSVPKSDPSYVMLNNDKQMLNNVTFYSFELKFLAPFLNSSDFYLNVITKTKNIDKMMLDGNSIKNEFHTYPYDNKYSYAQITIPNQGSHHLYNTDSNYFIAYVYTFRSGDAYSYSAGMGKIISKTINIDTLPPKLTFLNKLCDNYYSYVVTDSIIGDTVESSLQFDTGIKSIELINSNNITMVYTTSPIIRSDTTYYEFKINFFEIDPFKAGNAVLKLVDNAGNFIYDTLVFKPLSASFTIKSQDYYFNSNIEPGSMITLDISISNDNWFSKISNKFSYVFVYKTNWLLYKGLSSSPDLNNSWTVQLDSSKNIGDSTYLYISGLGTNPIQSNSIISRLKFFVLYDNAIEYLPQIESFITNDSCFTFKIENGTIDLNVCGYQIMQFSFSNTNYYLNINPNPSASNDIKLRYGIGLDSYLKIDIYNTYGDVVKQVYNKEVKSGEYTQSLNTNDLSSGIYYIRIASGPYTETKKLIIIK